MTTFAIDTDNNITTFDYWLNGAQQTSLTAASPTLSPFTSILPQGQLHLPVHKQRTHLPTSSTRNTSDLQR